jgi:hypothetical protein
MPVDVFYTVEGWPRLHLSVETPLAANEHIFDDTGTYRLTVIAVSAEAGSPEKLQLVVQWNGAWDNFKVFKGAEWRPPMR